MKNQYQNDWTPLQLAGVLFLALVVTIGAWVGEYHYRKFIVKQAIMELEAQREVQHNSGE